MLYVQLYVCGLPMSRPLTRVRMADMAARLDSMGPKQPDAAGRAQGASRSRIQRPLSSR